jgi:LysM repeat protein/N-acetylmuramoyl-L-alanine amidase
MHSVSNGGFLSTLAGICLFAFLNASSGAEAVHVVRTGDTLSGIAVRFGLSTGQLRRWNDLRGDRIYPGQRLKVDRGDGQYVVRKGDSLSRIATRFGLSVKRLQQLNPGVGARIYPGQKLNLLAANRTAHRVRRGDTLSEIAARHGTTVPYLKRLNRLRGDLISPGQVLKVRGAVEGTGELREYAVRQGDTLSEIALRFDVGVGLLRQLNRLKDSHIVPGQKLRLRPSKRDEAVHIVRRGETLSEIAARYRASVARIKSINGIAGSRILIGQKLRLRPTPTATHLVERGDALWEIARAYAMTVAEIKELNGLSTDRIYPGQELKLNAGTAARFEQYVVRRGDYLGEIARLHQMSLAELKTVNKLSASVIHPGDRLKVKPLLGGGGNRLTLSEIDWNKLRVRVGGVPRLDSDNGPYYYAAPAAKHQRRSGYYEEHPRSTLATYKKALRVWKSFEREVDDLGRLSDALNGWSIVLDPGHGGLDPGAVVKTLDGNGNVLYVVEDEYVFDIALRTFVLLRLHGADVFTTLISPNHLIRQSSPPTLTFVNQKNEVYNSYRLNRSDNRRNWPRGGNLDARVEIARGAFLDALARRRIFISFHADIDANAPEAPLVLYYESSDGRQRDTASKRFAGALLPALGAGARIRGQPLGVLRRNPADVKVLLELRNLAYTDHAWALRFEELRQRDAEKVVKGILDYAGSESRSAAR